MRIPSGLNEPSLYRGHRQGSRRPLAEGRRLLRLVLALVLVIVAIRQASRPEIYRPFFGDAQPPAVTDSPPTHAEGAKAQRASSGIRPAGAGDPTQQPAARRVTEVSGDVLRSVVQRLEPADRQRLTELLAWQRRQAQIHNGKTTGGKPMLRPPEGAEQVVAAVRSAAVAAGGEQDAARLAEAMQKAAAEGSSPDRAEETLPILAAVQAVLDRWYQAQVVDGGPWSRSDADAFYRYLERAAAPALHDSHRSTADPFSLDAATRIGVAPLLQQPEQYLGRPVAIGGTVARSERRPAAENPFGVSAYWEVWLRPDDGTEHPVVLYAPRVPVSVAAVGPDAGSQRGPAVIAVGPFLKRRLFVSAAGAEQAPVLVGRLVTPQPEAEIDADGRPLLLQAPQDDAAAPPGTDGSETAADAEGITLAVVVGLAAVLGIAVAGCLVWRSTVAASRSRSLRQRVQAPAAGALDQLQDAAYRATAQPTQEREE